MAKAAQLERVWCIIAEASQEAEEISQVLARETIPKINLSTASRDEIKSALRYLIEEGDKPLKGVNLAVATNKIDESDCKFWKNFEPVTKLKCGITKGKKLDSLKQVFYLTPEPKPEPEPIIVKSELNKLTVRELKQLAKDTGITGYSSLKKAELINKLKEKV
ncbi:Rho termination factor N-terminal domain-containing protein [Crocosphaera sp. UHCC 0190]|uniref:Rho termination factor N-terminal domain-containing protein n=1 Tax=Crocosphaera sp. UHCC 0190 TaxID=3110246 RepID=UPI002B21C527|nr:Rho termination factor N-terminal domain-containing protein [Crocosphaera sp. UHCC 0190]MEA5508997.1 Rho termination factor N-terminal domain-containing protein [Crocosphaera sp. UHCC 0190]